MRIVLWQGLWSLKRQRSSVWPRRPLDPTVILVARRFALRLLIVLLFAALPLPHSLGFLPMFVALTGFNALVTFFTGLLRGEKLNARTLTHYDEALWMGALCLVGALLL